MTKSKSLYLQCYKQKSTDTLLLESWRYKSTTCPICKENQLNEGYQFAICTYLDYINNQEMQLVPFCVECMQSEYLYSMSNDKLIYFKSKDDSVVFMIDIILFIYLYGQTYKDPISSWKVISFTNEKGITQYIKKFMWVEHQLVPTLYTPPGFGRDLPSSNEKLNRALERRYTKKVDDVINEPFVRTVALPVHIPKVEIKQFKIYSELRTKGD